MRRCCSSGRSAWGCPIAGSSGQPGGVPACCGAARRHPEPPSEAAGAAAEHVQALRCAHWSFSGRRRQPQHHPGEPLLSLRYTRTTLQRPSSRRWSSSCRSGTPTSPARASTCAAVPLPQERPRQRSLPAARLHAPWTASSWRRSWRISCGWTCPATTARACWIGCPSWIRAGRPSPSAPAYWKRRWRSGSTSSGAWTQRRMWTSAAWSRCCSGWSRAVWRARSYAKP